MNIPENSNKKRISIDLPEELITRFDQLRKEWGFRSRGPVIEKILKELLQEDDLLPKNQQQEIDFIEKKNNNENLNIDENTALVLIKSDINLLAALHVKGRFSVPSRFGHISLPNQSIAASTI